MASASLLFSELVTPTALGKLEGLLWYINFIVTQLLVKQFMQETKNTKFNIFSHRAYINRLFRLFSF